MFTLSGVQLDVQGDRRLRIGVKTRNNIIRVLATRHLTETAYIVRFERNGMEFEAGQYVSLGLPGTAEKREYSIYSGMHDAYLEVLIKEIGDGLVSRQLKQLRQGAMAEMEGPFGYFTLGTEQRSGGRLVFIASGTGIAPFHSYVKSYPSLDYCLIHGVRYGDESYEPEKYDPSRYVLCTSRDERGHYRGRVTGYLRENPPDNDAEYYLCGNSNMILDVYHFLKNTGVDTGRIHAEVYF